MVIILSIIKNGYEVDLDSLGLECINFEVESLSPEHTYSTVQGNDGLARIDTVYNARSIFTEFYLKADNNDDFIAKRDEIYKLFRQRDELTIIDNRQPHKRWIAQVESPFIIDNELSPNNDVFEVQFISKTIYAHGEPVTEVKTTDTNKFIVFNDGDFEIDGRYHALTMTFTGVSDKLRIRNNMNNSQWQYLGTTELGDVIKLERVYPYKNNTNIYEDTNKGYISLNEGSNEFEVFGATGDYTFKFEFIPLYI